MPQILVSAIFKKKICFNWLLCIDYLTHFLVTYIHTHICYRDGTYAIETVFIFDSKKTIAMNGCTGQDFMIDFSPPLILDVHVTSGVALIGINLWHAWQTNVTTTNNMLEFEIPAQTDG